VLAAAATLAVLIVQFVVRALMENFDHVRLFESITIKCEPSWEVVEKINYSITKNKADILRQEVYKDGGFFIIKMSVNMSTRTFASTFRELLAMKEIISLDK